MLFLSPNVFSLSVHLFAVLNPLFSNPIYVFHFIPSNFLTLGLHVLGTPCTEGRKSGHYQERKDKQVEKNGNLVKRIKIKYLFFRLVLESILRSDPLEPQERENSLPPRLYRLFQVVCLVEHRLTPQHPNSLRSALLRAIQGIVARSDIRITVKSLIDFLSTLYTMVHCDLNLIGSFWLFKLGMFTLRSNLLH